MDVSHPVDLSFNVTDQVALIDSVWQRGWVCILTSKCLKIRERKLTFRTTGSWWFINVTIQTGALVRPLSVDAFMITNSKNKTLIDI